MALPGLSLAQQWFDAPLSLSASTQLSYDFDVQTRSFLMPCSLLADQRAGVDEKDAVVLYFPLRDSWWVRWRFRLLMCGALHNHTSPISRRVGPAS
jgi:hypothetical protein